MTLICPHNKSDWLFRFTLRSRSHQFKIMGDLHLQSFFRNQALDWGMALPPILGLSLRSGIRTTRSPQIRRTGQNQEPCPVTVRCTVVAIMRQISLLSVTRALKSILTPQELAYREQICRNDCTILETLPIELRALTCRWVGLDWNNIDLAIGFS